MILEIFFLSWLNGVWVFDPTPKRKDNLLGWENCLLTLISSFQIKELSIKENLYLSESLQKKMTSALLMENLFKIEKKFFVSSTLGSFLELCSTSYKSNFSSKSILAIFVIALIFEFF